MNLAEFRKYLLIDKLALDTEIVRQPSLFFEVSEAFAEAVALRDAAKEELANVDADLDSKARKGKEKITEGQVKSFINASEDHTDCVATWLDAKKEADRLGALKEAFHQRSYMLRDLVSLHNANYFEETSVRSNASQDSLVYNARRARLSAARESKK